MLKKNIYQNKNNNRDNLFIYLVKLENKIKELENKIIELENKIIIQSSSLPQMPQAIKEFNELMKNIDSYENLN